MTIYTYVKHVDVDPLKDDIHVSSISILVSSVSLQGTILTIECVRQLSPDEERTLYNIVLNHEAKPAAFGVVAQKLDNAMDFGRQIIIEYATLNTLRALPVADVSKLLLNFSPVLLALLSGSIRTALLAIQSIPVDGHLIIQSNKDYFVAKLKKFLGDPP